MHFLVLLFSLTGTADAQARDGLDVLERLWVAHDPATSTSPPHDIDGAEHLVRAAGGTVHCDRSRWYTDSRGVERLRCMGTLPVGGHDATIGLSFRRLHPRGPPGEALTDAFVYSRQDSAFLRRAAREMTRRHGAPRVVGNDRGWGRRGTMLVLDDPSDEPCAGVCLPTLWLLPPGDSRLARFAP